VQPPCITTSVWEVCMAQRPLYYNCTTCVPPRHNVACVYPEKEVGGKEVDPPTKCLV
jgi:hypothetical protein